MIPRLHHSLPLLFCALCVSAVQTQAQNASLPEWFKKLDRDGSGTISRAEMPKLFERLDVDKDGVASVAEVTAYFTQAQKAAKGMAVSTVDNEEADKNVRSTDLVFFEKYIRSVLIKSCYECHSAEADKLKAGLALDARAALVKGGDGGAAVVPGKPEESLLIASQRHDDADLKMPP